MRQIKDAQLQIGEQDIAKIRFDPRSRDDIPKLLRGLQHIYTTPEIREAVFQVLEEMIPERVNPQNGRPGMQLWKVLVLGVLRLNLNRDYDRIHDLANNHRTIRQMLGHGLCDDELEYKLQTVKDNVALLTPEILDRINEIVIKSGHRLVKKKDENLSGRCDSFVVETDVHYPTDINLLFDALRKVISLMGVLCKEMGLSDWRQFGYNLRKAKRLFRKAQQIKRSRSKDDKKKAQREALIKEAHQTYLKVASHYLDKAEKTMQSVSVLSPGNSDGGLTLAIALDEIEKYIAHGRRQIDQIERRIIQDGEIAHEEKVFSIFEEHTEWISKGKAGVPVELGLRVCILEDQYGFILHHRVMEKETDDKIAVPMVSEAKEKYNTLKQCSFDKGFHSPNNQKTLRELLDRVVLPKKGKRSKIETQMETKEDFMKARRQHSAVESAINALEVHGLDRCLDHGINGFKRYVALAIVARNIQKLGAILREQEKKCGRQLKKAA